jgi:hypothetical protein
MAQRLLLRVLVTAPAVLVVGGHRGIIVARHTGDPTLVQARHDLVGPGRVPHEVPQVVDGGGVAAAVHVRENGVQRREVPVDVGEEREHGVG